MKKLVFIIALAIITTTIMTTAYAAGNDVIYQTLPIFDERNLTLLERKIIKIELGKRELSIGVPKEDHTGIQVYVEMKRITKTNIPHIETKTTILTADDYFVATITKKESEIESFFEVIKESIIEAAKKIDN